MFNNNEIIVSFNEGTYGKNYKSICDIYPIVPAKKIEKSWWKLMKTHFETIIGSRTELKAKGATLKYCPGIQDFTNYGYIVPAWQDFQFWVDNDGGVEWVVPPKMRQIYNVFAHGTEQVDTCPVLGDTAQCILKLISPWFMSTPKGTSLVFCKPFYHYGNDFDVCPGVLDSDIDRVANKLVNIFIRFNVKNKVIHIKAGQPLMQIIPFKRTNWKLKHVEIDKNFKDKAFYEDVLDDTRFSPNMIDKNSMTIARHDDSNKKFE